MYAYVIQFVIVFLCVCSHCLEGGGVDVVCPQVVMLSNTDSLRLCGACCWMAVIRLHDC